MEGKQSKLKLKLSPKNILIVLVVLISIGAAGFFYVKYQEAQSKLPEAVAARNTEESKRVISKLSKILNVSQDAEPTVARIENPDILKETNPEFYRDAQAGDYLIFYPERAIIYRESENKIINIAPIINPNALNPNQNSDEAVDSSNESNQENTQP